MPYPEEHSRTGPPDTLIRADFSRRRRLRPEEVTEDDLLIIGEFQLGDFSRFNIGTEQLNWMLHDEGIQLSDDSEWETIMANHLKKSIAAKLIQAMQVAKRLERSGIPVADVGAWMANDRFDGDMFNCFEMLGDGDYESWLEVDRAIDRLTPRSKPT